MSDLYDGPVSFFEGVHYPDENGPDLSRPLRWVEGVTYRAEEPGEPPHNEANNGVDLNLEVG